MLLLFNQVYTISLVCCIFVVFVVVFLFVKEKQNITLFSLSHGLTLKYYTFTRKKRKGEVQCREYMLPALWPATDTCLTCTMN